MFQYLSHCVVIICLGLKPRFMLCCCWVTESWPILSQPHGLLPAWLLYPWYFPARMLEQVCYFLLQGIFLTQELNLWLLPRLLNCRRVLLPLSQLGLPLCLVAARYSNSPCFHILISKIGQYFLYIMGSLWELNHQICQILKQPGTLQALRY